MMSLVKSVMSFLQTPSKVKRVDMISEPMFVSASQVLDDTSFRYTRKNGKTRVLCGKPSDWAEARIVTTSYTEFELHTPSCEVTNPGPSCLCFRSRVGCFRLLSGLSSSSSLSSHWS